MTATLSQRIARTSARANRERQQRAEVRLDEIVKVAGIADDYQAIDRHGDLLMERRFAELYQLVNTEEERAAVADAFAVWQRTEQAEERTVRGSVDESVTVLKTNNDFWLNGASVPGGSDGAA